MDDIQKPDSVPDVPGDLTALFLHLKDGNGNIRFLDMGSGEIVPIPFGDFITGFGLNDVTFEFPHI